MKIGAIDIGTNSMRLLLAEFRNNKIVNREKFVNTTRIGKSVDKEGFISNEAIKLNIDALSNYINICEENKCEKIFCIATSAVRDAKNGQEFTKLAKEICNIDIEVISGEEESELGFMGVIHGSSEEENILVIDIGGGSTEFIVGDKNGIKFSKSENIGALRMTEKFLSSKSNNESNYKEMEKFIENTIFDTINNINKYDIKKVIGIGGTITTVSAINQQMEVYSMEKIHNSKIMHSEIKNILQNLKKMTLNDKKRVKGLHEKRADIIVAGVNILDIIMKKIEKDVIFVSEFDNLEGLICQKLKKM